MASGGALTLREMGTLGEAYSNLAASQHRLAKTFDRLSILAGCLTILYLSLGCLLLARLLGIK